MITSYQLQVKADHDSDVWTTVLGAGGAPNLDLVYLLPISSEGQLIQARYRCQNEIGWGAYSIINFLLLANPPSRPGKPVYTASTATSISIQLIPSDDNGGATIL